MSRQTKRIRTKDPIYAWLAIEIPRVFSPLVDDFSFKLELIEANTRGCWVTYSRDDLKIQVWAEMGGRPEVDVIEAGGRRLAATAGK